MCFVFVLAFAFASLGLTGSAETFAADNKGIHSKGYEDALAKAQKLTFEFYKKAVNFKKEFSQAGIEASEQLQALAVGRRNHLLSVTAEYPEIVLKSALPSQLKKGLPHEISQFIEDEAKVEGELEVLHFDDFERSIWWEKLFIKTSNGKQFEIHTAGQKPAFQPVGVFGRGIKLFGERCQQ